MQKIIKRVLNISFSLFGREAFRSLYRNKIS